MKVCAVGTRLLDTVGINKPELGDESGTGTAFATMVILHDTRQAVVQPASDLPQRR